MHRYLADVLRCPHCSQPLNLDIKEESEAEIVEGSLSCAACQSRFPIRNGIPRFVHDNGYADNFAVQWHRFRQTQLDSYSGAPISRDRFSSFTRFTEANLKDQIVLDCGCGAGRFTEIALDLGARVVAIDISNAVDAARENLGSHSNVDFIQADILNLPFPPASFSRAYCLGVLQHTPSPQAAFKSLARVMDTGGILAIDIYPKRWFSVLLPKYWVRYLTRGLDIRTTSKLVDRLFPPLYFVSRKIGKLPKLGRKLRWVVPVANYEGVLPLNTKQARTWAYLDTLDMWAPAHDYPQNKSTVAKWFKSAGFDAIKIEQPGFIVGRGVKD